LVGSPFAFFELLSFSLGYLLIYPTQKHPVNSIQFAQFFKEEKIKYLKKESLSSEKYESYLTWVSFYALNQLKSDQEKISFWINIYNGLTSHLIVKRGIKNHMKEDPFFFKEKELRIDGINFSLDDIEHGILRRNARSHLPADDIRLVHQVSSVDYRIHFALNCGGSSCPVSSIYTSDSLESELSYSESVFNNSNFIVDDSNKSITCSPIFHWYLSDFENSYLNDLKYSKYRVYLSYYNWNI